MTSNCSPDAAEITETSCSKSIVGEVGQPPELWLRHETGIRFAPPVNDAVARIIFGQLQALIVKLAKYRSRCLDLRPMHLQQITILRVIEIASKQ